MSRSPSRPRDSLRANSTATARPSAGQARSLPAPLRTNLESLSGQSLNDVRVHHDSPQPASLSALAFAQGDEIHLGPGQERHLPHEAWHVIQQRQGRVAAHRQFKGRAFNDDPALEHEADRMGQEAMRGSGSGLDRSQLAPFASALRGGQAAFATTESSVVQCVPIEHQRNVTDGPYGWTSKYEIDIRQKEAVLTIRVQVTPDPGVSNQEATRVKKQTREEVQRQWDRRFNLRDAAGKDLPLRTQLEYVTANPHAVVALHAGTGHDDLSNWYVSSDATTRAHEIGHQMGMLDEYVDATVPNRATAASPGVHTDNSLMGNYYTDGITKAHVKQRHGDVLANDISAATGTAYTAVPSGIYITRDGDTLSSIALRLLGSAAKWKSIYARNKTVIKDPDKISAGITLKLP